MNDSNTFGADGIVTVNSDVVGAYIYDETGKVSVTNRGMGPNSKWKCDIGFSLDGHYFYRVATHQFLRDDQVTFSFE